MAMLRDFVKDDGGATAIEYGLILALIFVVMVAAFTAFASKATTIFNGASAAIVAAIN